MIKKEDNSMTIKELCTEYNITQTEISKWFGIPLRTVQDWYSGRRTPPDYVVNMMVAIIEHDTRY
jgi:putative transcriptional regulator